MKEFFNSHIWAFWKSCAYTLSCQDKVIREDKTRLEYDFLRLMFGHLEKINTFAHQITPEHALKKCKLDHLVSFTPLPNEERVHCNAFARIHRID